MSKPSNAIVLVAEDNQFDRLILKRAFAQGSTAELLFFADGQDLLDYLLTEVDLIDQGTNERLTALVLIDLQMPRLGGRETLARIREHPSLKPLPVIVLTTSDSEQHVQEMYELGANSYLVKPSNFDDLVDIVVKLDRFWSGAARLPKVLT